MSPFKKVVVRRLCAGCGITKITKRMGNTAKCEKCGMKYVKNKSGKWVPKPTKR